MEINLRIIGHIKTVEFISLITLALFSPKLATAQTWTRTSAPTDNWQAVAMSADGTKLVAVASSNPPTGCSIGHSPSPAPIYISTDSGNSWVSNDVPSLQWNSLAMSADGCKLVATAYGGGIWTLQTTPAPQMNIMPTNQSVALSWIVPSTNLVLQQSVDLQNWMAGPGTPVLNLTNLRNALTLSPTNGNGFYRLKTP